VWFNYKVDAQVDCIIIANATMAFERKTIFNAAPERALRLKIQIGERCGGA